MAHLKTLALAAGAMAIATASDAAVLTWTGAGDGTSFADDANWSGTATGGSIDTDNLVDAYVIDTDAAVEHTSFLLFRDGGSLEMSDGTLTNGPVFGGLGVLEVPDTLGSITLTGGTISEYYFIAELNFSLGGDATLRLLGGGNPINESTFDITSNDATLHLVNEDVAAFTTEHLSKLTVNGVAAEIGVNLSVESDGASGSIVRAIPEPASFALLGLGGLAMLSRRKG